MLFDRKGDSSGVGPANQILCLGEVIGHGLGHTDVEAGVYGDERLLVVQLGRRIDEDGIGVDAFEGLAEVGKLAWDMGRD